MIYMTAASKTESRKCVSLKPLMKSIILNLTLILKLITPYTRLQLVLPLLGSFAQLQPILPKLTELISFLNVGSLISLRKKIFLRLRLLKESMKLNTSSIVPELIPMIFIAQYSKTERMNPLRLFPAKANIIYQIKIKVLQLNRSSSRLPPNQEKVSQFHLLFMVTSSSDLTLTLLQLLRMIPVTYKAVWIT